MVGMKVNKKAAEKDEKDLERPSREEPPRRGQTCAYDLAFDYDRKYGGCGQTPLAAVLDSLGLQNDDIFKAGTSFSGGIANLGIGPCGAFSAGVLAISYEFGRERHSWYGYENLEFANLLVQKLYSKFMAEYGSICCRDIQKKVLGQSYDLLNPMERIKFSKASSEGLHCPKVVGKAAEWTVELILEGRKERRTQSMTCKIRRKGWEFMRFLKDFLFLR